MREGTKLSFKCQSPLQRVTNGPTPGKGQTCRTAWISTAVQGDCIENIPSNKNSRVQFPHSFYKWWNILMIPGLFSDFLVTETLI